MEVDVEVEPLVEVDVVGDVDVEVEVLVEVDVEVEPLVDVDVDVEPVVDVDVDVLVEVDVEVEPLVEVDVDAEVLVEVDGELVNVPGPVNSEPSAKIICCPAVLTIACRADIGNVVAEPEPDDLKNPVSSTVSAAETENPMLL